MALALGAQHARAASEAPREHRSVWITPYLDGNWPSAPLNNQSAADAQTKNIRNRMAKFKAQNINTVYFHVRSNCDAAYRSSYEPWSNRISGTRGQEPYGDPLQIIIDAAHAEGIEVYAWLNPYRYSENTSWGSHPLNYENSHPDWLIKNSRQTILNPGLEEVKQRIVDVITEIVTNYDIDGVLYDDYFYPQGGMPGAGGTGQDSDSEDYALWQKSGTSLSLYDWRRANINEMVSRVYSAIKTTKPWVRFGISPAGKSSPANIETTYGLKPIAGDWQYAQIYSDPLAWYKAGTVDFISPQIYWPDVYRTYTDWWTLAAQKFNRHLYPSVDISTMQAGLTQEFIDEAYYTRQAMQRDASGFVFFHYKNLVNYYENLFGKSVSVGENFGQSVWNTKALAPLNHWEAPHSPEYVANVTLSGTTLTWSAAPSGRYTVYAIPQGAESTFGCQREYLDGVAYTNQYTIPQDKATGYTWAVAVYNRYGEEFPPLATGQTLNTSPQAVALTYPQNGTEPGYIFDFKWTSPGAAGATFTLALDPQMAQVIARCDAPGASLPVTELPPLEIGRTYYWQVATKGLGQAQTLSPVGNFVASQIKITGPAHGQTEVDYRNPTITWQQGTAGTTYTLVVSDRADLQSPVVNETLTDCASHQIPSQTLCSGRTYYAQVTAQNGQAKSVSAISQFTTVVRTDYPAPTFLTPAANGETLYSNQCITLAPWEGMSSISLQVSTSASFPSRTGTATLGLSNFATQTKPAGELKISSKNLTDGTTYYVRAQGTYYTASGTAKTDYSETRTFVYSSAMGVENLEADGHTARYPREYFNLQGQPVANPQPGQMYIMRQGPKAVKIVK